VQAFTSFEPRTHLGCWAQAVIPTAGSMGSGNDAHPDGKTTPVSEEGESGVSTRQLRVFASIRGESDILPGTGGSESAA